MTFSNKKKYYLFLVIFFVCGQGIYGEKKDIIFPITLNSQFKTFYGNDEEKIFSLGSSRIIKDSVWVYINGFKIEPEERFRIDYTANNVIFFKPPPKESIIKVYFRVIPLSLKNIYYHRSGFSSTVSQEKKYSIKKSVKDVAVKKNEDNPDFEKSGSLIRGLSFHNKRGLVMNSGFRMDFSGEIGENLEVIASLTDQTSPLQPEGNTQTLNEIDKIFFKVRGKGYETTLGDLYVDYNGTEFLNYHRKLQGISGEGKFLSQNIQFTAAVAKGKYNTNKFMGREGNQGPYQLTGKNGERYIVVIGGTEKVWIDGELMKRGENNDYIIEYGSAQITFTRHRLITEESRIEVDFQYSDGNSRENIYTVKTNGSLLKGLNYNLSFIRENSVLDDNTNFSLSDIEFNPNALKEYQGEYFYQNGVSYVGPGKGNYQKIDSSGVIYYSFVGDNLGEYKVTFSRVEKGDYVFLEEDIYKWAGKGNGDFLPVIIIGKERGRSVGDIGFSYSPKKYVNFSSEIALSSDNNGMSGISAKDNLGNAVNFGFSINPEKLFLKGINLGKLNLSAKYKKRSEKFYSIDRTRNVEYHRKWDLKSDNVSGDSELEFNTQISPRPYISFNAALGKFGMGENIKSGRNSLQFKIFHKSLPQLSYLRESINSENLTYSGNWIRERGNVVYNVASFRPSFDFEREIKKEENGSFLNDGFRFSNIGGTIEYKKGNVFTGYSSFRVRKDKTADQFGFSPSSQSYTKNIGFNLQKGNTFSLSAGFINRNKKFEDNRENIITNLGDIKLKYSTKNRGIIFQNDYQLSSERVPRKMRMYFNVEDGRGEYSFNEQTGEYYLDINGNYVTRTFTTEEFNSVEGIKFGSSLDFNLSKFLEKNENIILRTLQGIKTKSIFRFEEKSKDKKQSNYLSFTKFNAEGDSTVFLGNVNILQDFVFFENIKNFYMRMRLNYSTSMNNQYIERSENRSFFEKSVEMKSNFVKNMGVLINLKNSSLIRNFSDKQAWGRDVISNNANIEFFYKPEIKVEYKARFKFGKEKNNSVYNKLNLFYVSVAPSFRYSITNKGRIRGEFEWFRVQTDPKVNTLAYEMAEGRKPGDNFRSSLNFEYRVANHITANIEYSGYKERRGVFHIGKVEMRAFF